MDLFSCMYMLGIAAVAALIFVALVDGVVNPHKPALWKHDPIQDDPRLLDLDENYVADLLDK